MSILQTLKPNPSFLPLFPNPKPNQNPILIYNPFFSPSTNPPPKPLRLSFSVAAAASNPTQNPDPNPNLKPKSRRERRPKSERPQETRENASEDYPTTIPRKPRRGRRSEAVAVEDFVRGSLERTFASIREQNSGILDEKDEILKKKIEEEEDDDEESDVEGEDGVKRRKEVVEEEDADWPLDADVGWGIRASEFFEKYPIKNVVEDGMEIDWEGELDDGWVKEINCLEWESFAFHPSPLMVLVFERYKRAADNWKLLKELEKATKVYWNAKDRLPPRTVKIDINIETDLAYALKAKDCPQLLFLRGNKILYREKEVRTADELVQMIAYFYYNAKKPSWIDDAALAPPY